MPREKIYYVYIMASKSRVIYVGMTGFLMARVLRHKAGEGGEFTRTDWSTTRYFTASATPSHAKPK
jgi:predicted GIY-YIG superfamily endonuclease